MDLRDFRTLIASGVVDRVILHRIEPESWGGQSGGFELWAFNDEDLWPRHLGNRLKVTRTNTNRTWTSVDRALEVIRTNGWLGTVEVEEPVRQVETGLRRLGDYA